MASGDFINWFLAGIATYEGAMKIMNLEKIGKSELESLRSNSQNNGSGQLQPFSLSELPSSMDEGEVEELYQRIKESFNEQNITDLYSMLGPLAKAQFSEEDVTKNIINLYTFLGEIQNGYYLRTQKSNQSGMYTRYFLEYSIEYEEAEKGYLTIQIIDDGSEQQIYGIMLGSY